MECLCNVCGNNAECMTVASFFGPMSYAICKDCLEAGKEPYNNMVYYIASVGHFPKDINSTYQALIREQLKLHGKSEEAFILDVDKVIKDFYSFCD